jgi:putative ABC transport system substrate-binding protein
MVQARIAAFRAELQKLGWVEGVNLRLDSRMAAGDVELLRSYAQELVALTPDVLFSAGTTPLTALQRETRTIPIVFAQVSDPVGLGFVSNVPRPTGNITGFALFETGIAVKWLELLKEIAPGIKRVAFIYDEANPASRSYLSVLEASASHFNVQISGALVQNVDDIIRTVTQFAREPNGALIIMQVPVNSVHRGQIIELADRHKLPAVYFYRYYVADGGLASYGVDIIDGYRRAASYIDRILRGATVSELPVQFPTKFELVINLKTAKAIGLAIPPTLIARADEVIE